MKRGIHLITYNWKALVEFELFYKLITTATVFPLFWALFNGLLRLRGFHYLTSENFMTFLLHPVAILGLAGIFLLMTVYAMIDIGAVIFIVEQSRQEEKASFVQTLVFAIQNAFHVFRRGNAMLVLVVIAMLPLIQFGVLTSFIGTLTLPDFIMEQVYSSWGWGLFYFGGIAALVYVLMRWFFAFHYFTLEDLSFKEARKKSLALGKGNRLRNLLIFGGIQIATWALYQIVALIGITVITLLTRALSANIILNSLLSGSISGFLLFTMILIAALQSPFTYAVLSVLFYHRKEQKGEPIVPLVEPNTKQHPKLRKFVNTVEWVGLAAGLVGCIWMGYQVQKGNVYATQKIEVTAHRGASTYYPENTLSAVRGAIDMGADWIEVDVQQSKDGQIFLSHDSNFRKLAGVNKNAWELTYEEIASLDVGSAFSAEFAGEAPPLLADVLDVAKLTGSRLNIELKPTGHETSLEESVVSLVEEKNAANLIVISSQEYETLKKVKAVNESIRTVYIMSLAYGDILRLDAADEFSVEASSVTRSLVNRIHGANKLISVWTVNTENAINKMIDYKVDNLVTDNIALARQCVQEAERSSAIREYIRLLQ